MMIRKPLIAVFAGLIVGALLIAESQPADAQLFQRLRQRVQLRRIAPPQPNNRQPRPAAQPAQRPATRPGQRSEVRPAQQPTAQRPAAQPNTSRYNSLRRIAPVNPGQPKPAAPDYKANRSAEGRPTGPVAASPVATDSLQALGPSILPPGGLVSPIAKEKSSSQEKPTLGIQIIQSRQGIPGLRVTAINSGSHAGQAGLQVDDLIVSVAGQPTRSAAEISRMLVGRQVGEKLQIGIVRNRATSSVDVPLMGKATGEPTVTTDDRPTDRIAKDGATKGQSTATLGMRYTSVNGLRGAVVTEIQKDSPASASGLETGDRIVAVDGRLLVSADALQQTLADHTKDLPVSFRMVRDGKLLSAKIDPNAKAAADDSLLASDSDSSKNGKPKSAMSSFGAVLGGLLSGKPKPKPQPEDEMELGDDEGVQQVDFESEVKAKETSSSTDPLSLETLEPPAKDDPVELLPPKLDSEKSPEELKREIRELEQRLKELEEKK